MYPRIPIDRRTRAIKTSIRVNPLLFLQGCLNFPSMLELLVVPNISFMAEAS
jgi:hypothetical protein